MFCWYMVFCWWVRGIQFHNHKLFKTVLIVYIQLEPEEKFIISVPDNIEVAAFLQINKAMLNNIELQGREFIEFDRNAGEIEIENKLHGLSEIFLFGG